MHLNEMEERPSGAGWDGTSLGDACVKFVRDGVATAQFHHQLDGILESPWKRTPGFVTGNVSREVSLMEEYPS